VKNSLRFLVLGASVVILAQACGSSDDKKKKAGDSPDYTAGGEGGEHNSAGGSRSGSAGMSSGGSAGTGGVSGGSSTDGGMTMSDAGMPATTAGTGGGATGGTTTGGTANGDAGMSGQAGLAGESGAGGQGSTTPACQSGFAECDNNPDTVCETPLNLVTSCGDCNTKCVATNGAAACTDNECVLTCNASYDDCDLKPENGCETNLVNNDKNCGTCGNDCSAYGATCATDLCAAIKMQHLAGVSSDNWGTNSWAFGPLGILANGFGSYTLRRLPLDGSAALTVWASNGKTAPVNGMAIVDTDVYWSERGSTNKTYGSVVYKKAITADAATQPTPVFVPELAATYLRRSGNSLYWASGGYQEEGSIAGGGGFIYGRALDALDTDAGTKLVTVDQGNFNNIKALGVTTDALYWVTNVAGAGTAYELRTAPLAGTPISVVPAVFANASLAISNAQAADGSTAMPVTLLADGNYVYFNRDANDAHDGIYRFKPGLTKPERLVIADDVWSMVLDSTYVYFVQRNVSGVWRVPINNGAGGAAQKIVNGNFEHLLGVDATYVYAAVSTACCQGSDFAKIIK
jgi:hypothetical protein